MRFSIDKKFIFFHTPKVAGSTICNALNDYNNSLYRLYTSENIKPGRRDGFLITALRHISAPEIKSALGSNYDKFFTFSFVRNPWDWKVSLYYYIKQTNGYGQYKSFTHYIKSMKTSTKTKDRLLKRSQHEYFFDKDDNPCVDFIGKFENLQEDFNTICDKIGIPRQELPHKNKSKHKHYSEHYDDETREIIAEKYAKDIKHFGYEFGE